MQKRFIMQMTKAKRVLGEGRKLITKTFAVNNGFTHNTITFLIHKLKFETDYNYQGGLSSADFVRPLATALLQANDRSKLHSFTL